MFAHDTARMLAAVVYLPAVGSELPSKLLSAAARRPGEAASECSETVSDLRLYLSG
jgi:hypothetical protein